MDGEGYAEKLISEALARGELVPMEGVGKPLRDLDHDPDWWVKGLLDREALPERRLAVERRRAALLADAISAPDLPAARLHLAAANDEARAWNADAPPSSQIAELSEIWLLDQRAGRPTRRPSVPGPGVLGPGALDGETPPAVRST